MGLIGWSSLVIADGADNVVTWFSGNGAPHYKGSYNTADGFQALYDNTTGNYNTATGYQALFSNTAASNTATGYEALSFNTTGTDNTAIGCGALTSNTTGSYNAAFGYAALEDNPKGSYNTAIGVGALWNTTGSHNTALGYDAGSPTASVNGGSYNILIGEGVTVGGLSNTIRIGNSNQTAAYIAGIYGSTSSSGSPVYVNSNGKLGTHTSSRRYKEDIKDMGEASSGLMKLRPVSFRYKSEYSDGPRTVQYGLIAEEVAEVYPDLVQYDPRTGQPETVYYHLVDAMLLNEVQKLQKEVSVLKEQNKELSALKEQLGEMAALKEQVRQLTALVEQNREFSGRLSKLEAPLDR
jgi:hypothetical protein